MISTDVMIKTFIMYYKKGIWKVESKAESDRKWIQMAKQLHVFSIKDQLLFEQEIKETEPPIVNNFSLKITDLGEVRFGITKIGRVFGFKRQDNGESGNFTIAPDVDGLPAYHAQPYNEFNIPYWSWEEE